MGRYIRNKLLLLHCIIFKQELYARLTVQFGQRFPFSPLMFRFCFAHRSSFPSESTQKAANHDEADAGSLPPGGAIGKPTANQGRVGESNAEEKTAQAEMADRYVKIS